MSSSGLEREHSVLARLTLTITVQLAELAVSSASSALSFAVNREYYAGRADFLTWFEPDGNAAVPIYADYSVGRASQYHC